MRWRLAVLLTLWLGTLASPFWAPFVHGTRPYIVPAPYDDPGPAPRHHAHLAQTALFLEPPYVAIEGCNGLPQVISFRLINNSTAAGTFVLDYRMVEGNGTLTGPEQLSVEGGQSVGFEVTLTPHLCALPGEQIAGGIQATGNGWTTSAELSQTVYVTPRWELAREHPVASFDWLVETGVDPNDGQEYMYVAGCDTNGIYRYDPRRDTWTSLSGTLPDNLGNAGDGATYQGRIYARGASEGTAKRLYIYDIATDAWSAREVPWNLIDRRWYEAIEIGGHIYFLGGMPLASDESSRAVDRFDPATGDWASAAPMIHPRAMAMAWAYEDKIYVAGGRDKAEPLSSTEVYDPASDTWTDDPAIFAPLPFALYGAGDAILDGQLWITGGYETSESDKTLYWDAADNTWHAGPRLARATYLTESTVVAGRLRTIGGLAGGAKLDDNQGLIVCPNRSECQGWLEGQVYDAELPGGAATCSTAGLSLNPGADAVVDPVTGRYGPLTLLPGAYLLEASAPGYSLEAADVTVEAGITITRDIGLWRPRVEAGPLLCSVVSDPGTSLTLPLYITNTGHLALEYQLLEVAPTAEGAPGDGLPWLRPSHTEGEIAPFQATTVGLTFECAAARDGHVVTGTLLLAHGDPCAAPIDIRVELQCRQRQCYGYLPLLLAGP